MNALKNKFSISIKLKYIKYYKIYKTLKKQQAKRPLVPILFAIP